LKDHGVPDLLWWIDLALLIVGGLIAVGALIVWSMRRRDPLRGAPLRPNRLGPVAVWLCITAYVLGGQAGASIGRRLAPPGLKDDRHQLWETIFAATVGGAACAAVCLLIGSQAFARGLRGLGFSRRPLLRDIAAAVPAFLASLAVCTGAAWATERIMRVLMHDFVPPEHSVFVALHTALPPAVRTMAFLGALVIAPISEELLFRGMLQSAVRRLIPPEQHSLRHRWLAIAAVAVLFGAMHSPTPQHMPALAIFGAILGFLYERTGSLVLPILVHFLFNGKSLLWDTLLR
jgi:membrane protease YdiL (CAAX protease family)